jgi:hypothetical protein
MVKREGKISESIPLSYAGSPNTFYGKLHIQRDGIYEIIVYAYDPLTGNTGVDKLKVQAI